MGAVLPRGHGQAPLEGDDFLLGTCDALVANPERYRVYETVLPFDAKLLLALHGFAVAVLAAAAFAVPGGNRVFDHVRDFLLGLSFIGAFWLAVLILHIPRRVVRRSDAFVFDFLVISRTVPLVDVLELVVLRKGSHFLQLLQRWKVFPFGSRLHLFFGMRSSEVPRCVLLTRHFLGNFIFLLQDPVQFLLDNQNPLTLGATYRTVSMARMREGESLQSKALLTIPRGRVLKVEEQLGRRVLVTLPGGTERGWISYISTSGTMLLAREQNGSEPIAGTVGASELSRGGDGSAVEMGLLLHAAGAE
eukprot:CAMPEP_0170570358 /NCGR_PEP_ID=MMETSP0224-20130122/1062_1 /TAXON_ID=285029 /ORGANISM="Togula jolla, Strain CCCM 725" /LENGTH=304 /DNA_ID=CAMNT_0010892619 /DNA_START=31 /DNA_END=945 /DNA_ORIENTATION=+